MIGRSTVSVAALALTVGVSFAAPAAFVSNDASLAVESSAGSPAHIRAAVRSKCCGPHEHDADGRHPEEAVEVKVEAPGGDKEKVVFVHFPVPGGQGGEETVDDTPTVIIEEDEDDDEDVAAPVAPVPAPVVAPEPIVLPEPDVFTFPEATPIPDDPVCFPAAATVEMEDGSVKRMDALAIGDRVKVGTDVYSDVFMFTHKLADSVNAFVQLHLASGDVLRLTPGHYIYVNQGLTAAKDVAVGDSVELGSGARTAVRAVSGVSDTGLFNPQTLHGDIVVDNVRASTYTTAVTPTLAHTLLSPLRMMFYAGLAKDPSFGLLNNGAGPVASAL